MSEKELSSRPPNDAKCQETTKLLRISKWGGGGVLLNVGFAQKEKKIDFQLLAISGGKTGGQTQ